MTIVRRKLLPKKVTPAHPRRKLPHTTGSRRHDAAVARTTLHGWHNHTGHILLGHDKRMRDLLEGIRALDLKEDSVQVRDSKGEMITVVMDHNGVARKK